MKPRFTLFLFSVVSISLVALRLRPVTLSSIVRSSGEPAQVHLSVTRISDINVNWASDTASNTSQVKYGLTTGIYTQSSNGTYHQYVSTWDIYTSPFLYTATMSNLAPATTYYYVVGDPITNLWSPEYSFRTVPDDIIHVVAYGDQGENQHSVDLLNLIISSSPNLVLHAGDIAYANGNSLIWDQYMNFLEPLASQVPYMVAPGNHEAVNGENFVPYTNLFAMPNNKFWYSFNYGPMHIIAFSTEHAYDNTSAQYQFLVADLESVNRMETPWIFFFAHKPPYNSNANYGSFLNVRAALEPLFSKYSVDLGIFGHEHSYERTWPLHPGALIATSANGTSQDPFMSQEGSTIYTVVGTGGEGLRNGWMSPTPEWSAYHQAARNGFASIYVKGGDYLHWQYITDDNQVSDEFYLCKNLTCDFSSTTSTASTGATISSSTGVDMSTTSSIGATMSGDKTTTGALVSEGNKKQIVGLLWLLSIILL